MKYTLIKVPGKELWECPHKCGKTWPTPLGDPPTRIPRPLEQRCIDQADAEVAKCPHLKAPKGSRRKIKWRKGYGDSEDYPCRRRWVDAYLACKNKKKPVPPPKPPGPVAPCCKKTTGDLVVKVLDSKNNPLDNAGVYFWKTGDKGKTGQDGTIRFKNLPQGKRFTLRVWKDATKVSGYTFVWPETVTQTPIIEACKEVAHTVTLPKAQIPGKLQVLVVDDADKILEKATTSLKPEVWKPSNVALRKPAKGGRKTDKLGLAYYENLPIDNYEVQAAYEDSVSNVGKVRIKDHNWHKTKLAIDFSNFETKTFSILVERASWMGLSNKAGIISLSAVFRIQYGASSARYQVNNALLAGGGVGLPIPIEGGQSKAEGRPVSFKAVKYRNGKEFDVKDFVGRVNIKIQSVGIGPINLWRTNLDIEFIGIPNPNTKNRHSRKSGLGGWMQVDNVKPGDFSSTPGASFFSGTNIPFSAKTTL
ncbi:MAG: hypothetical protein MI799_05550 [Desulfobacterales bacterium]|nr:hypothetical protein [Desulfobacterales bacterium]